MSRNCIPPLKLNSHGYDIICDPLNFAPPLEKPVTNKPQFIIIKTLAMLFEE